MQREVIYWRCVVNGLVYVVREVRIVGHVQAAVMPCDSGTETKQ